MNTRCDLNKLEDCQDYMDRLQELQDRFEAHENYNNTESPKKSFEEIVKESMHRMTIQQKEVDTLDQEMKEKLMQDLFAENLDSDSLSKKECEMDR